jgi:hypothetical protein
MQLNGTPGQTLIAYYAEPGAPEHDALTLLDRSLQDEPEWSPDDSQDTLSAESTPDSRTP